MALMILGGTTLPHNPPEFERVYPLDKDVATMRTLDSEALFDFGIRSEEEGLIGTRWSMRWPHMLRVDYNTLHAFYTTGGEIQWEPGDHRPHETAATYKVIVVSAKCVDYTNYTTRVKDVEVVVEIRRVN